MAREYTEREKWFIECIGLTIYRNKTTCDCLICTKVHENGLVVSDHNHATYLFETECEYNNEGYPLKYFDTKEEATEFELKNNPLQE